jgi:hypothetical protein
MLTNRENFLIMASVAIAIYIKDNPSMIYYGGRDNNAIVDSLCDHIVDNTDLMDSSLCKDYVLSWFEASFMAIGALTLGVVVFQDIPSLCLKLIEKLGENFSATSNSKTVPHEEMRFS